MLLQLLSASPAASAAIDRTPILKVEVGSHTAMIRRMSVDTRLGIVVTASDDKTARIWSLERRRLLRTLRIPIADGNEGRLYALAVHGDLIAVGGFTGIEWDGTSAVYFFSVSTGKILNRIGGLPGPVGNLRFSDDGRTLAICVFGERSRYSGGVVFVDVSSGSVIASDTDYAGYALGIDFNITSGFAISSYDGFVRLYDSDFTLRRKKKLAVGSSPSEIKFSPDGSRLAVGFVDSPRVTVLRTDDLSTAFSTNRSEAPYSKNLPGVAWSLDGTVVYAIGDSIGEKAQIHRWTYYGRPLSTFSVGANRLTAIVPLPEMQIALSTEDPSIVILDQDGEVEYLSNPDIIQFQNVAESMRLSSDGKIVAFQQGTQSPYTVFSIEDQTLDVVARVPPTLFGIRTQHENIRVDNWKDVHILDQMPTLNGRPISLQQYDISRSLAVSNNGKYAVIGTDWGIYLIDSTATTIWEKKTSYVVWGLNISGDGKIFVAALSDGTIRWYRMDDSIEIMAAYFHPNGEDWIAWTPEGYYTSSPNGDQYIGWHINRGIDETPDFYRAVQFERVLFRPDIVQSHFASEGRQPVRRPDLASIAPPRIELTRLKTKSKGGINSAQVVFQIDVEKNSQPMRDFGIYINNIPVTPASERQLVSADRSRFTREIVVDLNEPDNLIRVEVFNGKSMGLLERYVEGPARKLEPLKGDLYLFAVGANQFDNVVRCADPDRRDWRWNSLDFASADAAAIKNLFLDMEGETFNKVHWRLLSDDEGSAPTKANIEKEIDFVKKAGPNDTVIIFLASHGISNSRGNYYFVPRDGSIEDGCRLYDDRDDIETLVSWEVFFDALRVTAGRRLMIIDTCHSGDMQIDDKFDAFSLTKRSTASSFALMSAATGVQESQEYYKGGQGLFTYSVLDALRKGVDYDGDGWTTLREVFDYSKPFVEQYRDKSIPQTPVLVDPEPLGETRLGRAPRNDMAAIPNYAQPSGATL